MNSLLRELRHRISRLNQAKDFCMKHLEGAPEGRLRIDLGKEKPHYYVNSSPSSSYRYIRQDELELVPKLAQKAYCEKVIRKIEAEIRAIENDKFPIKLTVPFWYEWEAPQAARERKLSCNAPRSVSDRGMIIRWVD